MSDPGKEVTDSAESLVDEVTDNTESPATEVADSAESLSEFDVPADIGVEAGFDTAGEAGGVGTELDATAADTELKVLFGRLVLLYKVSMLGTTLGVLFVVFDRGPDIGVELLAGGLVLLAYTLYETKRGKDRVESGEFHGGET